VTRSAFPAPSGAAGARLLGFGHYRPERVVTNDDLVAMGVDTDDEWIRTRVGVVERRYAAPDETITDMAEAASRNAMANSGVRAGDIDLVIVATCTMPTPVPSAAPQLAARLGIEAPGAFDVSSGCSGFVYSLNVASAAVLTGQARHVLVVASERFSGWLDFADRTTCVILGDGAAAAVVGASDEHGFGPVVWGSDGAQFDAVAIDEQTRYFRQEGQSVYRWATSAMAPVALDACERAGVKPDELAAFIPHQANLRIIDSIAKRLGVRDEIVARDIETSGNTSAATIPLAFSRLLEAGSIPSGSPVLLLGFGSGLAYAGQVVTAP
jgi:3-oxoacyl-[acyl-carrier-protein] synthase-3